ncbi:MAG: GNAT family N-acetyltransferase [Planctomycetota bacterium]|nr:GNAT family N-acetyltransferase [Planctomycetota bacterium]
MNQQEPDHKQGTTFPTELSIRPATADDVPLILAFIRELAEFERLTHEVIATEDDLRRTLFGEHPHAEVIIASIADDPVGFALFFHNYSTFLARPGLYVEDLYVREAHRGRGVGRAMFTHLARIARDRECGRLEWWVLDWNERAIRFYETLGAQPMADWTVYRLGGEALAKMADDGGSEAATPFGGAGR